MKRKLLLTGYVSLGVLAILALGAGYLWHHDSPPANEPMGEQVNPDEAYYTSQIIAGAIQLSVNNRDQQLAEGGHPTGVDLAADPGYKPGTYLRDVHSKDHGCVLAKFQVNPVPSRFAYGVFAAPHTYDAILRFSSGKPGIHPDQDADAHGLAIKLFDVPGQKLLPGEEDGTEQDFILMDNPVFFIRTLKQYQAFSQALASGDLMGISYFFPNKLNPLTWHLREMQLALGTLKKMPASLVTTRYYSASAYALGPNQYVKYSVVPDPANRPRAVPPAAGDPNPKKDPDYLRLELAQQARAGTAKLAFEVQPQVPGADMPVEDTTVNWSTKVSPFVPVAEITIPPQDNNTAAMNERCENLEFNPWHSLPAHRPVGVMNRVREALYQAMADFRRSHNGQPLAH